MIPSASPAVGRLSRRIEFSALEVHGDRDRDKLEYDEMRRLDQEKPRLGLDLRVVQRALVERDRRALAVNDALSRRMALAPGAFEPDVEQPHGRRRIALRIAT